MGILAPIMIGVLHLAAVAIDIVAVFVLARLLRRSVRWQWLVALEAFGRPLTDQALAIVEQRVPSARGGGFGEVGGLALALLALLGIRIVCSVIAAAVG